MITRRTVLAGGVAAGLAGTLGGPVAFAQGRGARPFRIEDALDRTDIRRAIGCERGERWALEVMPPMPTEGRFGTISSALPSGTQLWLCDEQLGRRRILSEATHWDWAPRFSPGGHRIAWLTSSDGTAVTLAAEIGGERRDFQERVEIEVSFGGAADSVFGKPSPFMWLDTHSLLFVRDASSPYTPELRVSASFDHRASLRERLARGENSVRVWNADSPTCGYANSLCRLDVMTGQSTSIFDGDVRGVSVSPDGRFAAILAAIEHLGPEEYRRVNMPMHRNPFFDVLVRTQLFVVDIYSKRILDLPTTRTMGVVSGRELPLWSGDSRRVTVICRDAFDELAAGYSVRVIDVETGDATELGATSQLDAEVLAHLMAQFGPAIDLVERRPQLRDTSTQSLAASHVTPFDRGVYVDDGERAFLFDADAQSIEVSDRRSPGRPTLSLDGSLVAYGSSDGIPYRWTCSGRAIARRNLTDEHIEGAIQVLTVNPRGNALIMSAAPSGTSIWAIADAVPRRTALALNAGLGDVITPTALMVPYRNARGEARNGMLLLPTSPELGPRPPVVMWAYPDDRPHRDGWMPKINHWATRVHPFQLLLAAGFAVFWADYPGYEGDPQTRILAEMLPCVDLLRGRADVDGTRIGFYGHSNAGYVALTLAAHSAVFKAIVAAATFPDWAAANVSVDAYYRDTVCGGFAMQQNRYFTEGRAMPYPMNGPRWEARDQYLRNSPLDHLHNLRTPLLLSVGEMDTSAREMEMAYVVAQATGTPTELAFYQGESHVLNGRANVIDMHDRTLAWFRRHLAE